MRHFDDVKMQEIYNIEFAKEVAKVDAASEKGNAKSTISWIFMGCVLGALILFFRKYFKHCFL